MAFHPSKAETYHEATDAELLRAMCRHTKDIGWALQAEILRRQTQKLHETAERFNQASSEQSRRTIELARSALWVAIWQVVVALFTGGFGLFLSWKINRDALARRTENRRRAEESIVNGVQWEIGIAQVVCRAFLKEEPSMAKSMGSPVWIAQTDAMHQALSTGLFDDKPRAVDAIQNLIAYLNNLNERNHLMASASVDAMPFRTEAAFLRNNLHRYGSDCKQFLNDADSARETILEDAVSKGLRVTPIDVTKIDFHPRQVAKTERKVRKS